MRTLVTATRVHTPKCHNFGPPAAVDPSSHYATIIHSWKVDEEIDDHLFEKPCEPTKKGLRASKKKSLAEAGSLFSLRKN